MSGRRSRAATRSPKRRRALAALGVLGLLVAALALLAIPMLRVPGEAQAAKNDLTKVRTALQGGDTARARDLVESARGHVEAAQDGVQGVGGDVWSIFPVIGTPVDDARHLVQALDDATTVAELGLDLYPRVSGPEATLFRKDQIDEGTLDAVIAGTRKAGEHLASADAELDEVRGSTPFVGDTIQEQRDAAAAQVAPLASGYAHVEPLLNALPEVLGFRGKRTYLIAMLNPSELRYSGGATLAYAPMTWDHGAVEVGDTVDRKQNPRFWKNIDWRKVRGNWFHRSGKRSINNATFAPSWSISGEELLRAWHRVTGNRDDGVLAIDVVALSQLFAITGDVEVPGYGTLTADNLVHTLVGNYDAFYPDPTVQDPLNAALLTNFKGQLLSGGHFIDKGRALSSAADGRHFAMYLRDDQAQSGIESLGMAGDLTAPEGDYLGVFTQNTNASKADYWQRRRVSLDVTLAADGSARNELDVAVHNDSPPHAVPVPDLQVGYFTRWAGIALSVFLPDGAMVDHASLLGERWDPKLRSFYEHDFIARSLLLEPSATGRLKLGYAVQDAATVDESGDLTYRLAIDPQGMVNQESVAVTVHLPQGYRATGLPEGWTADGDAVTYAVDHLASSQEWEIGVEKSN